MATCISKQALKKGNIKQGNGNKCKQRLTLPGEERERKHISIYSCCRRTRELRLSNWARHELRHELPARVVNCKLRQLIDGRAEAWRRKGYTNTPVIRR